MTKTKMQIKNTFDIFAKKPHSMIRQVTTACEIYNESLLVRCFSRGLDDNFEATWVADTNRSICWEGIEVDQYVSAAFCIKLKLQSMNKWASSSQKKDDNAATWKYGPSHPPPTSMDQPDRQPSTSYTHHWTSKKDLSPKEASILLTCYSCICCRKTVTP